MRLTFCFLLWAVALLSSCGSRKIDRPSGDGDTIRFTYASQIAAVRYKDYTVVTLKNPWRAGQVLHTYVLVNRADSARVKNLPHGTVVYIPVQHSVVFTTAHCQLLEYLHSGDAIVGVCDLKYILIPTIRQRVENRKIIDCGEGMTPAIEKIIDLHPQALLVSPFENSGGFGKLDKLDIPIIECADYMETSSLGRAEWMKFYGLLYGCEQRADSLFAVVESNYNRLKAIARKMSLGRSVLLERKTGSVWYCPGGQSTIGRMIADANARYVFSADAHSGSLTLPFETVLDKAGDSDVWLIKTFGEKMSSKKDLLAEYQGYSALKAFKTEQIFVCNTAGRPYFEETPFRPDYLLEELIGILHTTDSHSYQKGRGYFSQIGGL